MKLSFGVILLNQKILMSVILFSVILFYPFYYDEGYNETNNQKNESYEPEIVSGIVVVKLKSATSVHDLVNKSSATGIVSLDTKLKRYNTLGVEKMFKHKSIQEQSDIVGIDRIIKVKIPEDLNPIQVIQDLKTDPNVEYAEPIYKRYFFDIPNDPKYPEQDYLKQIKAPEAWDKQKGDSNVVIAINDGGVDLKHEDLKANLWTNEVEANGIPGIDDDNNGFIDDIHGWDFGDNDPDPSNPPSDIMYFDHGTHCAGIASAITDNNIGVSGVSWNCKIMPIKISSENAWPLIIGYYGIIYAADNGADIISNSWGGTGYLQWEQDVIDYAYSKGSIVVCATADIGGDILIYPSAYHHSISVAAVDVDDTKLWFSTYGPSIDICAPGNNILSTIPGNSYEIHMGTSMACPIVAGVFGLVKSLHQDWDNDQIIKQVLLSSDDINSKNPSFKYQLGHGRINAFSALTLSNLPEPDARFSLDSFEFNDSLYGDNDNVFEPGETVVLKTVLRNYSIGKANSASFILTCANPKIEILSGDHSGISFQADTTMQFEFLIKLNEELKSKNVELEISMETTMGYLKSETIPLTIGTNPVLLLDHDFGGSNQLAPFMQLESFYINILKQNNIPFTYWDCSKFGLPKLEYLFNYPIVIMFKEILEDYGTLPINSCKKIESYLNNGGNLFICGPNIGYNLYEWQPDQEIKDFMQKYLHAEFLANKSSDLLVEGIENDPISNGLSFNLWQPYLPNDFQSFDVIKPTNGATSLFIYGNGKTGAVKYSGNYK